MKFITLSLLTLFCALLCVQFACAAGLQIHGICSTTATHQGHEESCQWDPCVQGFSSPSKAKLVDNQSDFPSHADVRHFLMTADHGPQTVDLLDGVPSASPFLASNIPLLI